MRIESPFIFPLSTLVQVIRMPAECPEEVTAFIFSWLYHEPTKLELSDDPVNLEFLFKLKLGAEFLGIADLASHIDVVIDQIHIKGETLR